MKRKNLILIVIIFTLLLSEISAQHTYISPLDIPISLSGNFGEIRNNHFHSGIDIKTQGVIGKKVYSVHDGYISRIYVSPYGFGLALYVTHPSTGTTSVYAHLDRFATKIDDYIRKIQYSSKKTSVDKYLSASEFPVKKGDLIAYTGDSGSSGGPHLHFEIRDADSQSPINIIAEGICKITDNIKPKILSVSLVEVDTIKGVPVHITKNKFATKEGFDGVYSISDTIKITRPSYFAIEVTDRKNGVDNTFGIKKMTVERNGKNYFGFDINRISFSTTRYINSLMLYPQTKSTRNDIFRTYISPNNRLSIYADVANRGIISPNMVRNIEKIDVTVNDDCNNTSMLTFFIKQGDNNSVSVKKEDEVLENTTSVWWLKGWSYDDSVFSVSIPPKALYESALVTISVVKDSKGYSDIINTSNEDTPLQSPIAISIKADRVPMSLINKALIVKKGNNNSKSALSTTLKDGILSAASSSFGSFGIDIDTIQPVITPQGFPVKTTDATLRFKISDNLSGVKDWKVYIDDKWVRTHYDTKNSIISHRFSDGVVSKGIKHSVRVEVTDGVGNKKDYKNSFTW